MTCYKDLHGFWIRRIYLTYDGDISDKFKARARIEMASDGKFGTKAVDLVPYVKDAYLDYKFHSLHSLRLGIQESLAFSNTEKFWGYRHVEKMALDLFKLRSSRDFGVALSGSFAKDKKVSYTVMYGNESGYRTETNKQKAVYGRLTFNPSSSFMLEI